MLATFADCIQVRTSDEATAAMGLDGVMWDESPLRVRRPKDYIGIDPSLGLAGLAGMTAASPNKLFIGGLPTYLNDEQVLELLKSFGELRSFNLVKESTAGGESKVNKIICHELMQGVRFCGIHRHPNDRHGNCGVTQLPARRQDTCSPACRGRSKYRYPSCDPWFCRFPYSS